MAPLTSIIEPADADVHLTIRLCPSTAAKIDKVLAAAAKESLRAPGTKNPIRVKQSHVLRLAIERGIGAVLEDLRKISEQVEATELAKAKKVKAAK